MRRAGLGGTLATTAWSATLKITTSLSAAERMSKREGGCEAPRWRGAMGPTNGRKQFLNFKRKGKGLQK